MDPLRLHVKQVNDLQGPSTDKPKEDKDEVDESKFDEFMGNDAGKLSGQK